MTHWLPAFIPLLFLAACTPISEQEDGRARCSILEGPDCRRSVPGELPPPMTEIGKLARQCPKPRYCGPIGFVDCGSAADGPAYFFERRSGKVVGFCGGYCMMQSEKCEKTCPPPEWTCKG